ncbi:hypothetical protein [Nocardioides sp.]|uniref:hypothetical protein n=1 Tax=Nocardioides sp. TaxID=35761 RepID=UPI0027353FDB|nr:hypothetical protein [Nocardioides sp.]MDP3891238.1 hypothetical protein [Nocardioides sp.]
MQIRRSRQSSGFVHLLRRRLVILVATAMGFLLVTAAISVGLVPSTISASDRAATPASSGTGANAGDLATSRTLELLLERHGCWSGQAPADMQGQIPGGVVVTRAGAAAPAYGGATMVARALDHVFAGEHPDLVVHGFCR